MEIYIEASNTAHTGARSGIPTVVRGLAAGLALQQCDVRPVRWSFQGRCLTPLKTKWEANLDRSAGKESHLPWASLSQPRHWPLWLRTLGQDYKAPIHLHPAYASMLEGRWLLLPELMQGEHVRLVRDYARKHGMRVAGIFHDAIPLLHPELVFHRTPEGHAGYMKAFAGLDAVIAVSEKSTQDFVQFAEQKKLRLPPVHACRLPAQIAGQERETALKKKTDDVVRILYVSTLEPRKNHLMVLAAFEEACATLVNINMELHLVGGAYPSAPEIAEKVRAATRSNPRIFWHEEVGPAALRDFYRDCDFTVFASWIEGFGLPVMESLWFGRPCLCSDEGVMAENARDGGCLMVNMKDQAAVAVGLAKLAGDPEFRRELGEQVLRRKLKTWDEYGGEILQILKGI